MPNFTNVSTLFNMEWFPKDAVSNLTSAATEGIKAGVSTALDSSWQYQAAALGALAIGAAGAGYVLARHCSSLSYFNHRKSKQAPLTPRSAAKEEEKKTSPELKADSVEGKANPADIQVQPVAAPLPEDKATSSEGKSAAKPAAANTAVAKETPPPERTSSNKYKNPI